MKSQFLSHSAKETKDFAKNLARQILLKSPKEKYAFVLGLEGELGAGKTSFVQGFAKGLGVKEKVLSPTFLIMRKYQIPNTRYLYHVDCYRLKGAQELLALGWKAIVADPRNIVVVEWADKVKSIIPKDALWLTFSHTGKTKRTLSFVGTIC